MPLPSTTSKRSVKLSGEKVILSPITPRDLVLFEHWMNDLTVTKYLKAAPRIFTLADEKAWLKKVLTQKSKCVLAIIDKKTGETIGNIGLHTINTIHKSASLGIVIGDKKYWGRGYGKDAISLILDFAFTVQNLHCVYLNVYAYNKRAIRAYTSLGFKQTGILRERHFWGGAYHNVITMDILDHEFLNSRLKNCIFES